MKPLQSWLLFAGIGGFELAAEALGWSNVFSVEFDPFCSRILQHHFPETHHHNDIHDFNAKPYRGNIDIITGGFPCQPFSTAGKRHVTSDNRYLWKEMLPGYSKLAPPMSWRRMFVASLIGQRGWSSMRCALTWKVKETVVPCLLPDWVSGAPQARSHLV